MMRNDGKEQQTCLQRSQAGFPPRAEGKVVRGNGPTILWLQGQKEILKFPICLFLSPLLLNSTGFGATQCKSNQFHDPD